MLERIGRYEVLAEIGRGGMGDVYAARLRGESRFARLYAIKRIRDDLAADERFVAMFFDEARTAACIHSAHVVPVLDVARDDGDRPFMVMDLVLGANLRDLVSAGPLPFETAHALVLDAARGLRDAHATVDPYGERLDVVHRDVSPRNVLVGADGSARLTDFGIAKARGRMAVTSPGEIKGSYGYWSPEHLHGATDAQSDVFSLGIVAWELYAGRRLFDARTMSEIASAISSAPIPDLATSSGVPPEVGHAIARALLRDRERRFRRAEDLLHALEAAPVRPAARDEIGRRACEVGHALIAQVRRLDEGGIAEAKTVLAAIDTLRDSRFDRTTVPSDAPPREHDTVDEIPTRRGY
jgi:eukaryotic-like serine/threonine-protein kinase